AVGGIPAEDDGMQGDIMQDTTLSQRLADTSLTETPPGLPAPPQPQHIGVSDHLFASYVEDCMSSDFAVVATGQEMVHLTPRSQLSTWTSLEGVLRNLGFHTAHTDAWADAAAGRLEAAADSIRRELASTGGRGGLRAPPRRLCQELGTMGLAFLHTLRAADSVIGTQCSNHLGLTAAQLTPALSAGEATDMCLALCSSASDACWTRLAGKEVILWSPAAAEDFGRLLGGFVRHLGLGHRGTTLQLVCPLDELPGCSTPTAILQHWAHPGLGERWAGVLAKVEFMLQPLEQVSPGGRFAQVSWRPVGLLTFQHEALLTLPTTLTMEEPWKQVAVGQATINLDFPSRAEAQALEAAAAVLAMGWGQSEPRRSPASQKSDPRLRLTLYSGEASCTALDAAVFARELHKLLLPMGGVAARGDIFMDDTALIMSTTGPGAFTVAGGNCLELLPLSTRTAVARTSLDETRWEEDMRNWQAADPQRCLYHLRHKRLVNEGGLWVSAPGTANVQRQRAARTDEVSARLLLQLHGPPGPRPDLVVQAAGDMIHRALGQQVRRIHQDEALEAYTLRPERGTVAGALTGRLELA
ncbi:unnamed protein product, partial [Prorocentrum cordatum]